jgi:hypothetical protein
MDVQKLQDIINTSTNPKAVERAKKQLEGLQAIGTAQVQMAADAGGSEDPQLNAIMTMLQQVVSSKGLSGTANINPQDVRNLISRSWR